MSRVGKVPISIPSGVSVDLKATQVSVKGPKGNLSMPLRSEIKVSVEGETVQVSVSGVGSDRFARAMHGTTRALIANMFIGVTTGFEKKLDIIGVGWNAKTQGKNLTLNIGFCHPVEFTMPDGVEVETPGPNQIVLRGADRQAVGQMAAIIRKVRPPEPYKGKGIRYNGEYVRRKAGKSFGT
ncbi:MAG TPA: 50S ribosomal protein L6 [Planctomycetes bacterium]|jgi:large subunit ribosomal protein L6|nr:50S ribosomal protein L6 [Planctomycetota bacterium]HIL36507.1 50S ribosomal protein L6 [Planctomycetota bacterium]